MNDWVGLSRRTKLLSFLAAALWSVAVGVGIAAGSTGDVWLAGAGTAMLVLILGASAWCLASARRMPKNAPDRRAWMLIGIGIGIEGIVAVVLALTGEGVSSTTTSTVGAFAFMAGNVPVGFGVIVAAASKWRATGFRGRLVRVGLLSLSTFGVLGFAMSGPTPWMSGDLSFRDLAALVALGGDIALFFAPALLATLASLGLPDAQRARGWIWVVAGALVCCMADVSYPLVQANNGEVYPTMLWALGMLLVAGGASMAFDIERELAGGAEAGRVALAREALGEE